MFQIKNGNKCSCKVFKKSKCKTVNGRQPTHTAQRGTNIDSNRLPDQKTYKKTES